MNSFIEEIARIMAHKAALINICIRDNAYQNNIREYPFFSELKGIEQTLKTMGIDYKYDFDESVTYIIGVHIGNVHVEV